MFNRIPIAAALAVLVAVVLTSTSPGQPGTPSAPPSGDPPGWAKALQAKQRHAQRLLDLPGIAGIGVGVNKAGKPVIEIYKENDNVKGVPKQLDDVPVEATTTGVLMARAPTDEFPRPVPIGVSSGHLNTATGTLGARVVDGSGTVYALSNNHVFAAVNSASIGDGIIQPGNVDGGTDPEDRIGTLHDFQQINFSGGSTNTMDAAIALTSTGMVGIATPPDGYGAPSTVTAQAFVGQPVQKYGRTTGFQTGTVNSTNATVDVCYVFFIACFQQARFVNQITISPGAFSAAGDSGSLIVTQGGNQPVALLFAGGDGLTIGNPIDVVLQRFGVTIDGIVPPPGPPSAPVGLAAVAGDATATLSWTAPYNGGQPITHYKIYRGENGGAKSLLATVDPTPTSFNDSGLTNGTTYNYAVSAESSLGEGPMSNEASATPTTADTPAEPLPIVDSFNRANENPLSGAGSWTNGVAGSGENGLFLTSNVVACSKGTTCTAWRNAPAYGPDSEAWTTVTTLPGTGNAVRVKVRLQTPGSNAVDGYMLQWVQASGPDTVALYKLTNSSLTVLASASREIAAGTRLFVRARGNALEAWVQEGSTWTRVVQTTDSTYPGAGYAGVGLRGTTGRIDDFGARNFEPPAPPSAPTAPTNLQAQPGDTTVSLTWTAPSSSGAAPLAGYNIYRGVNGGAKSLLTTVGTALTSFQDLGLTNGTLYAYEVSAVNEATLEGPRSNEASATPIAAADPPSAPTNLQAQPGNATVSLTWTAPASDGGAPLTGYNIYRGVNGGAKSLLTTVATTPTSFNDSGLTNGTLYAYEVSAVNQATLESPHSNEASATPAPPPPTAPGAPTNLQAQPGNATVALSWTAPSSSGGVPLTGYNIYRGVNGGAKSLLTTVATTPTSFNDSGLTNGSLYAYEVSAVNQAALESQHSNEASATPLGVDVPAEPLPVLDSFNRANENPLSGAGSWTNGAAGSGETGLFLTSNVVACSKSTTCTAWRNTPAYGPDSEAWTTVTTLPGNGNAVRVKLRLQTPGSTAVDGYMLQYIQASGADTVALYRITNSTLTVLASASREIAAGTRLFARARGNALEAWVQEGSTWTRVVQTTDSTYPNAGYAGVGLRGTAGRIDDFGARNYGPPAPPTAPGAPTNLQAQPGNATVALSWTAPSSSGGVPLTGYNIYRGVNGGAKSLLTTVATTPTSFNDSGLTNGSLYAYEVSAVNQAALESQHSNEASATPLGVDVPAEPLPVLDSFNRANENPLSGAGSWTNGIAGNGERSLRVISNQLAGGKSTTTTAWRNATQYADTEVWATIAALPGNGNAFRLNARLQQPGSSAADGYFLQYLQASGTDQVALYRLTNGTLTLLASANRELSVGARLFLRVRGTSLEAWVQEGSTWTRVVQTTDSTYQGAGYAGVGIRGTTGRLDDFGAR